MCDCFIITQILQLNEQYQYLVIVQLKQNKPRVFLKGNIFHGVVKYEKMKS